MTFFAEYKKSIFVQIFIYYAFIVFGLIINIIELATFLFIKPLNKKFYRKLNYYLSNALWSNITWWGQHYSPTIIELYMKEEDRKMFGKESVLCVLNHRYSVDWLMGWILCQHFGILGGCKVVLKNALRYVPIIGWSFYFSEQIFVKRVWETDNKTLVRDLQAVFDYPDDLKFCVCIFCEGTRFSEEKHKVSMEIANRKGITLLKHHLLPRTKGFKLVASQLTKKVDYLYDVNLIIDDVDGQVASISHINNGIGLKVKYFVRRIPFSSIPVDDDKECEKFLLNLYKEKDEIIDYYHQNKNFDKYDFKRVELKKNNRDLISTVIFNLIILVPSIYYLLFMFFHSSMMVKLIAVSILFVVNYCVKYMMKYSDPKYASTFGLNKPKAE